MTIVHIPAPDIEADVSAEQVVSYLHASGWVYRATYEGLHMYNRDGSVVAVVPAPRAPTFALATLITDIARAEQRHPSAVLAAIVGPAVGGASGVECERRRGWYDRFMCGDRLVLPRDADERDDG